MTIYAAVNIKTPRTKLFISILVPEGVGPSDFISPSLDHPTPPRIEPL